MCREVWALTGGPPLGRDYRQGLAASSRLIPVKSPVILSSVRTRKVRPTGGGETWLGQLGRS